MKDKQTKLWLSMFVLALMFVGGAVSYASKNNEFYRGTLQLGKDHLSAQTSVLTASEPDVSSILPPPPAPKKESLKQILDKSIGQHAGKYAIKADSQTTSMKCPTGTVPVLRDSKIAGCLSNAQTAAIQPAAKRLIVPRIQIIK